MLFDFSPALFGLISARLALDDIGQLNDHVQLSAASLLIHHIQQGQFSHQLLHSRVRGIHDCVKRIFNQSHHLLRESDFLLLPGQLIEQSHTHMVRVPLHRHTNAHGVDFVAVAVARVKVRFLWHNRCNALFQKGHHDVLNQASARLVGIGLSIQAIIKARINNRIKPIIFIELYVVDRNGCSIQRDAVIDGVDDGALTPTGKAHPVRAVTVAAPIISASGRVPVEKGVPSVFQPGANVHLHFEFFLQKEKAHQASSQCANLE